MEYTLDAKFINLFLTEGVKTFREMFNITAEVKEPHLLDIHAGPPWEISDLLGITGDYKGVVAFRLHKTLARKMLLLSGLECTEQEFEDTEIGLVTEFTNIISGHAVSAVNRPEHRHFAAVLRVGTQPHDFLAARHSGRGHSLRYALRSV